LKRTRGWVQWTVSSVQYNGSDETMNRSVGEMNQRQGRMPEDPYCGPFAERLGFPLRRLPRLGQRATVARPHVVWPYAVGASGLRRRHRANRGRGARRVRRFAGCALGGSAVVRRGGACEPSGRPRCHDAVLRRNTRASMRSDIAPYTVFDAVVTHEMDVRRCRGSVIDAVCC
jgi:hypothetical protein